MRFRFGPFILDKDARELLRDGAPVHLSPKAYLLLEALLENRPKALSKADLHGRIWPRTFVVETNLANLVAEIRSLIGDEPRRPRFLRTVHGFGYAFRDTGSEEVSEGTSSGLRTREGEPAHRVIWQRRVIPLEAGENLIGRARDVAVSIEAPGVSRRHARIVIEHDLATLEDLGSRNGTYLEERRLNEPVVLRDGDAFRIGGQLLIYSSSRLDPRTETITEG
jgi:DNA-binding winged helix-turn-helix (wHTH) protein